MASGGDKQLIEQLSHSAVYRDYERAFSTATGLPLALRPVEHWQMALHGQKNENPFCPLMARTNGSCAACLEVQEKIASGATDQPKPFGVSRNPRAANDNGRPATPAWQAQRKA